MKGMINQLTQKVYADKLKLFSKKINFELGDEIFHQLLGTAIGTKFAPNYANILTARLKRKLLANNKFNPFLWLLFLDEIFCIWTDGEEKLKEFFEYLNQFHPIIKFTMEISFNKMNFLDGFNFLVYLERVSF